MLMHVNDLVPELELESDVRLKAGSFLITRKELKDGRLSEKVIESIQRFAAQLAPESYKVSVKGDERALNQVKSILEKDLLNIAEAIESGKEYPNFLKDDDLRVKVMRVMEKLISNPDLIRHIYDFKISNIEANSVEQQLLNHSIRVTLLSIALGLQLRWSIISLVNVGMAAILHDMGIIRTALFPDLKKLDDMLPAELEGFINEHQKKSVELFGEHKVTLLPYTRAEILHIISNHHRPNFEDARHKTTLLLYFAELVDEMIAPMTHKVRYNFTPEQIRKLGERFARRTGLVNVLLGLIRLYKGKGPAWDMVMGLVRVFSMDELLVEGYEEKLKEIIDFCPFNCAVAYPHAGGNSLPRTIYCNNSTDPDFTCDHMGQVKIEIFLSAGKVKSFNKCATLTEQVHQLNISGREEAEQQKKKVGEQKKEEKAESRAEAEPTAHKAASEQEIIEDLFGGQGGGFAPDDESGEPDGPPRSSGGR
ncbi:HD domain-containing protein [bacterium]|nr:HD domain-containing protein [bacterium]